MLLEQLGRIDLNLLIILQVLLEERNGSKAARRLHLSQSAVSKALGRLRETFDDPLFIRSAYGLEPTPVHWCCNSSCNPSCCRWTT